MRAALGLLGLATLLTIAVAPLDDAEARMTKASPKLDRVLLFTRAETFRHTSIDDAVAALDRLGSQNGFTIEHTENPAAFTDRSLRRYDVVMFVLTTGDVLDAAHERALERYMRRGGGYVGVHSAADTEHDWPWYGELVGAQFRSHPAQQLGTFTVEAPDHPSVAHLPNPWTILDEFYSFERNPRGQVRVLLSIDEASYLPNPNTSCLPNSPTFPDGYDGRMGDHPMSWCHDNLGGRAWYTALGHEIYLYQQAAFREHILNGILSAARRVAASCAVEDPAPAVPADPALYACPETLLP